MELALTLFRAEDAREIKRLKAENAASIEQHGHDMTTIHELSELIGERQAIIEHRIAIANLRQPMGVHEPVRK